MVIKSILQRFWLAAIQQWLPCRPINLIRKKVNFDLLQSWASLHPFLGNLQNNDIYISPWGTLLPISIIGDSITTGKSAHLGAARLTIMSTVTQTNGGTALINPSARRTRVGRKRTPQKAPASPASNMVVLNGGLGREKRLWEPSCRENASKSQLLRS
jgi:hypothetical protein